MDGLKAFKYYTAIKLHFTTEKFDVFQNKGRINCSYDAFVRRNDHKLFEKLGAMYSDREMVQFCASNFMYGNLDLVYNIDDAQSNYREWNRRRESMTKIFTDDCHTMEQYREENRIVNDNSYIMTLLLGGRITIESVRIVEDLHPFLDGLPDTLKMILSSQVLRIKKSKGFVKYSPEKISKIIDQYSEILFS